MDVRRLGILRELRDRGTVGAVADAMNLTPSAVSQQLKVLEHEAGHRLVQPAGRGVELTVAGLALADAAVDIAVAIERAEGRWREFMARPAGQVTLTTFATAGEMLLPGLLHRLTEFPDIDLRCSVEEGVAVDFALLVPDYDIVLADGPSGSAQWHDRGLEVVPLMSEPLDIAMPVGHRLAAKATVSPKDLMGERWIGAPRDFPYDRVLQQIVSVMGEPADIVQRIADNSITEALVAAGHGIAILPRFTTRQHGAELTTRPVVGMRVRRDISALLRPDRFERPAVRAIIKHLKSEARAVADAHGAP